MSPYSHNMMKKTKNIQNWMLALCCTVTITACSEAEPLTPADNNIPIAFQAEDNWDGTPVGRSDTAFPYDKFGVYAYHTEGDSETQFMVNQYVYKEGDVWKYSPTQYWPFSGTLSFYAYAPYSTDYPDEQEASGGEVNIPLDGQTDILWASRPHMTYEQGKDGVTFGFQHLLSQLQFRFVKGDGFEDGITVNEIKLTNTKINASLNVKDGTLGFTDEYADKKLTLSGSFSIGTAEANPSATLICMPGNTALNFIITTTETSCNSYEATATFEAAMVAGSSYILTFTFNGKTLYFEGITLNEDWTDATGDFNYSTN